MVSNKAGKSKKASDISFSVNIDLLCSRNGRKPAAPIAMPIIVGDICNCSAHSGMMTRSIMPIALVLPPEAHAA